MTHCRFIGRILPAAVLLAATILPSAAAEPVRILRVRHRVIDTRRASPSLMPDRLGPADAGAADAVSERFLVYWQAGPDGSPPGTVATFEFRQAFSPLIRTLFIQYPFKVKGERCATFEVAEPTIRRGGRVVAWRARILVGGRRWAERTSESWEP